MSLVIIISNIFSSFACIEILITLEILVDSQYFGSFFDYVKGDNSRSFHPILLKFGIVLGITVCQFFFSSTHIEKPTFGQILAI